MYVRARKDVSSVASSMWVSARKDVCSDAGSMWVCETNSIYSVAWSMCVCAREDVSSVKRSSCVSALCIAVFYQPDTFEEPPIVGGWSSIFPDWNGTTRWYMYNIYVCIYIYICNILLTYRLFFHSFGLSAIWLTIPNFQIRDGVLLQQDVGFGTWFSHLAIGESIYLPQRSQTKKRWRVVLVCLTICILVQSYDGPIDIPSVNQTYQLEFHHYSYFEDFSSYQPPFIEDFPASHVWLPEGMLLG